MGKRSYDFALHKQECVSTLMYTMIKFNFIDTKTKSLNYKKMSVTEKDIQIMVGVCNIGRRLTAPNPFSFVVNR